VRHKEEIVIFKDNDNRLAATYGSFITYYHIERIGKRMAGLGLNTYCRCQHSSTKQCFTE
jgi:hypothetical protein